MRKFAAVLCVLVIFLFAVAGCEARLHAPTENGAEDKGDRYFYDETSGKILTGLSDRFDFKIEQWELRPDGKTGLARLLFNVTIKNKTKTRLNNFNCDILFDKRLIDFFTTGLTNYDQYEPVDLIPDVTANGAGYSVDLSLNTDKQMTEFGAEKDKLFEAAQFVTLEMNWEGGEETVTLDCGKLEKAEKSLLTVNDFINIELSAPEGSGAIRTMTLHYMQNGEEKSDVLNNIARIDCDGYDDDAREQTLTSSDEDGDEIADFIVYREFWFPDLKLIHPEIPLWPTVYEYDLSNGFVIASAKHATIFAQYAETLKNRLESGKEEMTDNVLLSLKRLIAAAEHVADGSFGPASAYSDKHYYKDVYRLTKDIK